MSTAFLQDERLVDLLVKQSTEGLASARSSSTEAVIAALAIHRSRSESFEHCSIRERCSGLSERPRAERTARTAWTLPFRTPALSPFANPALSPFANPALSPSAKPIALPSAQRADAISSTCRISSRTSMRSSPSSSAGRRRAAARRSARRSSMPRWDGPPRSSA